MLEIVDAWWPDDPDLLSLAELAQRSGASEAEVYELVEHEVLEPVEHGAAPMFRSEGVTIVRHALHVRRSFALDDVHSVAVVLRYEARIEALEREIRTLRARRGR